MILQAGGFGYELRTTAEGRLTTESGVAVSFSDRSSQGTIYYTPFLGSRIALYDGTNWQLYAFTERSLALSGLIPLGVVSNVFLYDNAGTLTLELGHWTNSTVTVTIASPGVVSWTAHGLSNGDCIVFTTTGALPTGLAVNTQYYIVNKTANDFQLSATLGGTAINTSGSQSGTHTAYVISVGAGNTTNPMGLTTQDGVYVKSGSTTRRWLGLIRTSAANVTEDSVTKRFLWNAYNGVHRRVIKSMGSSNHTYNVSTTRQYNADATAQVEVLCGLQGFTTYMTYGGTLTNSGNSYGRYSVGNNSTVTETGLAAGHSNTNGENLNGAAPIELSLGYSKLVLTQNSSAVNTHTYDFGSISGMHQC